MKYVVNRIVILFVLCGCAHVNEEKNITHSDVPQSDSTVIENNFSISHVHQTDLTIIENNLSIIANYRYVLAP